MALVNLFLWEAVTSDSLSLRFKSVLFPAVVCWYQCQLLAALLSYVSGGRAALDLVLLRLTSDTDSRNLLVGWLVSLAPSGESGLRNIGNVGLASLFPRWGCQFYGPVAALRPTQELVSPFKNGGWVKSGGQSPITLSLIFMFSLGVLS